jgi:hypothetical protein
MASKKAVFNVSEWIQNVRAKQETEMNEEIALKLFEQSNALDNDTKKAERDSAFVAVGLTTKEKDRETVGFYTDNGLLTFTVIVYKNGEFATSNVQLWVDNSDKVNSYRKAGKEPLLIDGKAYARIYRIGGTFIITNKIACKYRNGDFIAHTNAAESFWVRACFERTDKWFKIG